MLVTPFLLAVLPLVVQCPEYLGGRFGLSSPVSPRPLAAERLKSLGLISLLVSILSPSLSEDRLLAFEGISQLSRPVSQPSA